MKVTTNNGDIFEVDEQDLALALNPGWHVLIDRYKLSNGKVSSIRRYVQRNSKGNNGIRTTEYLHRLILKAPKGVQVDHINGNGLDNRRSNLRLATTSQNKANSKLEVRNKSGYKGVHWSTRDNKWRAQITVYGKCKYIGIFNDVNEAVAAYNQAAIQYFGEYAKLNTSPLTLARC